MSYIFTFFLFVLCILCCQFLWIVHFWLPLRYSLTFINNRNEGVGLWTVTWNTREDKNKGRETCRKTKKVFLSVYCCLFLYCISKFVGQTSLVSEIATNYVFHVWAYKVQYIMVVALVSVMSRNSVHVYVTNCTGLCSVPDYPINQYRMQPKAPQAWGPC